VLVELGVVEQRYRAVLEVLEEGVWVTEVACRHGVARQANLGSFTPGRCVRPEGSAGGNGSREWQSRALRKSIVPQGNSAVARCVLFVSLWGNA
jgi:hypothetical protein